MSSYAEPARSMSATDQSVDEYAAGSADEQAAPYAVSRGAGWVTFAGVMLIVAGLANLVDGLWALDVSDSAAVSDEVEELLWYTDSLETWGWIYTIGGVLLLVTGIAVFSRNQVARWVGVAFACGSATINMMWVFSYPIPALIHVGLASMVIYGLTAYGERAPSAS